MTANHENVSILSKMPLITNTSYTGPSVLFNGHLQTIFPALFRKHLSLPFDRERITTPDGDFLDLDWLRQDSKKLVIICHGLEGDSRRPYMRGMAKHFFQNKYDVLTWNFRGCSGELNIRPFFYHSGATYDLETVVNHAAEKYAQVYLIGFSLGGNLTLKYLGEPLPKSSKIKKAVAISVPLHLKSSCTKISSKENLIYSNRFLKTLKVKVQQKALMFPDDLSTDGLQKVKTLKEFDDKFTGPMHGYRDADHYYDQCSSLYYLDGITIPTLILNAKNDPFLSEECFPVEKAHSLEKVFMEFPEIGGHVGFTPRKRKEIYWSENRAFEFIDSDA
ncbi:putative hydrolase of the alpha/beta-hydrolase fold protein [Echinicola vietnamensis DSM 17526]|uniref:Putative hydrolase of the alpha/beta-hydrolase fold protein n=2 Tax=Echinicola TaxID=390846 RepID=L0G1M5_ECHVK|nr:putative hydrolase of the alpha/beta-hydrolase fold protein [Echinicola vietnamensis DSM 17526]